MDNISDESLFSLWLSGNVEARNELTVRYYRYRLYHCHKVAPLLTAKFDSGDLNYVTFVSFQNALDHFSLMLGSFLNYYLTILEHEVSKKARELALIGPESPLSLDAPVFGKEDEMSLHDVIPSGEQNNPKMYLNYMEEAEGLGCLPKTIDRRVLAVARLRYEGHPFASIAKLLHESDKQVRSKYALYKNFIEHGIKIGTFKGALDRQAFQRMRNSSALSKRNVRLKKAKP